MLVSLASCVWLRRRGERYVSTGILLVGIAAFIGAVRYGPNPDVADLHRFTSALATAAGLPLIAVQYLSTAFGWPGPAGRMNTMGLSVVGFAAFGLAFPLAGYGTVIGAVCMIAVAVAGAKALPQHPKRGAAAVFGAAGFALAGLVIGTEGMLGPLRRIDAFHYVLCLAVLGLAWGLPHRADDAETR